MINSHCSPSGVYEIASFPGLPAFVTCSTTVLVLQAANAGVRRPGNEAIHQTIELKNSQVVFAFDSMSYDMRYTYHDIKRNDV